MDTQPLKKIGLDDKEITIYTTLLQEGESTAGELAKKTSLHRRTTYDTLDSLQEHGLVTHVEKDRVQHYHATNPQRLLDMLQEQQTAVQNILPQLQQLQEQSKDDTHARIFQGKKSVKKIFEDILNHQHYAVMGAGTPFRNMLGPYFNQFQQRKKQNDIESQVLIAQEYAGEDVDTDTYGTVRHLKQYDPPTTTYIYNAKVAIILSKPPLGVLIESKQVAESFQNYFNLLWELAE